jgi:S1-C subfamily serine protease
MPQHSAPRSVLPLVAAAVIGGGVAAGTVVLVNDAQHGPTHTTTVIRQAAIAAGGADRHTVSGGLTAADIYRRYAPGVAFVRAEVTSQSESPFDPFGQQQESESTGSGFVVDKAGDILTNNHVVEGATKVTVQFADEKLVPAKIVGRDASTDLALLRIDPTGIVLHPLPLGSSKDVQVGDPTLAIGNPFGLDRTLTTGVVSALQREIQAPNGFAIKDVIQTDAAINPGNSGGPLIDAAGRVIGINSQIETGGAGSRGSVGIGFAVPIDTAKNILAQLKRGGEVQRAYLGVNSLTVDKTLESLDLSVKHGALVQTVEPGGPAATAGLLAGSYTVTLKGADASGTGSTTIIIGGDIVTAIDGTPVSTSEQLAQLVSAHKPGDKVKLQIVRKGKRFTVQVTLGTRPATLPNG